MRARLRVTSVLAMIAQHVAQDPNPLDASLMHGFEFELAHSISLAGEGARSPPIGDTPFIILSEIRRSVTIVIGSVISRAPPGLARGHLKLLERILPTVSGLNLLQVEERVPDERASILPLFHSVSTRLLERRCRSDCRARTGAVKSGALDTLGQNGFAHIRLFYVTSSARQLKHVLKLLVQESLLRGDRFVSARCSPLPRDIMSRWDRLDLHAFASAE